MSNYHNPVKVIQTDNWLFELKRNIDDLKIISPFIVTSQGNRKRLNLDTIFNPRSIYGYAGSNPTFDDGKQIIKYCKNQSFDGVIAIGGGSPMDLAKVALSHLCTEKSDINQLINFKDNYPISIPSIFIPTTHGTGSEVTMWGTIWDMKEKKKYSISHIDLYPDVAILDANLTLSLPSDISIITVMDALSHSFEAIWNKNANDISTSYAVEAISLILENVEELKKDYNNLTIRNKLLIASNKAGLAFSNTKTAAAHSISYPLTIHYGIPHGVASSITLVPLLDINRDSIKEPLEIIINKLGMNYKELKGAIHSIPESIIPLELSKWGITMEQIPKILKESFTKGRMENNIVDLKADDVLQILKNIY